MRSGGRSSLCRYSTHRSSGFSLGSRRRHLPQAGGGGRQGPTLEVVTEVVDSRPRLVALNIQPSRGENGMVRRGFSNSNIRGSSCGQWTMATGIPVLMQPEAHPSALAAQILLDRALQHAPATYSALLASGRLQQASHQLQALGQVPVVLLQFNEATHVVDEQHVSIQQGVLVVTAPEADGFTWTIANPLRDVVAALGGRYERGIYISRGMTTSPTGVLERAWYAPRDFWHAPLYAEHAAAHGHSWETHLQSLRACLEGYGATVTIVDARDNEPAPLEAVGLPAL